MHLSDGRTSALCISSASLSARRDHRTFLSFWPFPFLHHFFPFYFALREKTTIKNKTYAVYGHFLPNRGKNTRNDDNNQVAFGRIAQNRFSHPFQWWASSLNVLYYNRKGRFDWVRFNCLIQLDKLVLRLSEVAPLKSHKYFRVTVPQALTGQTLVQLLQELLKLDDASDALHLATLLMHYGYIFPVIEQASTVKDDNTLYRIQLPYFWPSHAQQTDNVEYGFYLIKYKICALLAIYLNKRLMRNEQKHGLEEGEVASYNKLVELLGHMWPFITIQAEMQLKMQKERKKVDKIVFDSEERAFWRLRQPGQPNCLEQHIRKIERRIRKMNIDGHRQQVGRSMWKLSTIFIG
jgi:hypothetical protein